MKNVWKKGISTLLAGTVALGCTACGGAAGTAAPAAGDTASSTASSTTSAATVPSPLDPNKPTPITIWNYYNGDQLAAFDALVTEFNSTVGVEQGIAVTSVSQGSIDNLADCLIAAADGKVGAQDLPTLAAVYAETAYILDERDLLTDLDAYFTADDLAGYITNFVDEGRLVEGGGLMLFPISKSTESFAINKTDWAPFEAATGTKLESITSNEKLVEAAAAYYAYTDGLTPDVPEDGKALYGRDSVANYVYIGAIQLGHEPFKVEAAGMTKDMDRATFKTLWDNYYVPYINGYFVNEAKFSSEDMKTGAILALTGSSSGVSYLPTAVTDVNDVSHDIEIALAKPLSFEGGEAVAVQQGAGYAVLKSNEAEQYAAVEFLKWFTETDRNLAFSLASGYSSVTVAGNSEEAIRSSVATAESSAKELNTLNALLISSDVFKNERTYTNKPFKGSRDVRNILADDLTSVCVADREAVKADIAAGKTREEAVAPYITDEYFDAWFEKLCSDVDAAIA